jgi:hypothetical protein
MFDIKKKVRTKWFIFEEDEKYLLKYMTDEEQDQIKQFESQPNKFRNKIVNFVLDWEGIVSDGKPLKCNPQNKQLVFCQDDWWSIERIQWVIKKIINYNEFFDIAVNLKN